MSFTLWDGGKAIRCDQCWRTSWNLDDVRNRYCGHCRKYHDDMDREAQSADPRFVIKRWNNETEAFEPCPTRVAHYTVPSDWNNRDNRVEVFPAPGVTWNMENGSTVRFEDTPAAPAADECRAPDPTPSIDFGYSSAPDCSPSSTDTGGWSDV